MSMRDKYLYNIAKSKGFKQQDEKARMEEQIKHRVTMFGSTYKNGPSKEPIDQRSFAKLYLERTIKICETIQKRLLHGKN